MNRNTTSSLISAIVGIAKSTLPPGSRVTLYGSRARGDARFDSDWDLQVLIPGPERLSIDSAMQYAMPFDDVGLEYSEIVNTRVYTFAGWLKRQFLPFYKNVETEGLVIYQS